MVAESQTTLVSVSPEEVETMEQENRGALVVAGEFAVESQSDLELGANVLGNLKGRERAIRAKLDPIVSKANEAHKALTSLRSEMLVPITDATRAVKSAMAAWITEQQRLADEAERVRRQEAETAERKRRKEEEAAARQRKKDEEAALALAQTLEDEGRPEEAAAALDQVETEAPPPPMPPPPPPTPVAQAPARVKGISTSTKWTVEVEDRKALAAAWIAGALPGDVLTVNQGRLNQMARANQGKIQIPGCRIRSEATVSNRR